MAGHSKWSTIKRRKAKADAQRSGIISKAVKEIVSAARHGGGNVDSNYRLKMAIDKAKAANVSVDSIARAIKRGAGEGGEGVIVEELTYEGYGSGGAAVIVKAETDNRNRTAGEVRFLFSKYGGKLAEIGSVGWMFQEKGVIVLERDNLSEEDAFLAAIDAGAEDFKSEDDSFVVTTEPKDLDRVRGALLAVPGITVSSAELDLLPMTTVEVSGEEAQVLLGLLESLEGHDDVVGVYSNLDISGPEAEAAE